MNSEFNSRWEHHATLADVVIAVVWRTIERGSIPLGSTKVKSNANLCPDGGMVYTLVLETSAERIESSSLSWGTIIATQVCVVVL